MGARVGHREVPHGDSARAAGARPKATAVRIPAPPAGAFEGRSASAGALAGSSRVRLTQGP